MKPWIKYPFVISVLTAALGLMLAGHARAQIFTNLHSFTALVPGYTNGSFVFYSNSDGALPIGGLVILGDTLYGTASSGGTGNVGTVFSLRTNGTGFTTLHHFSAYPDGGPPRAGLTVAGNTLYGTTKVGEYGDGSIFHLNIDGAGYTRLASFLSDIEAYPLGLILSNDTLYGTESGGHQSSNGHVYGGGVFGVKTNSICCGNVEQFYTFSEAPAYSPIVNFDGAYINSGLVLSSNWLYGTANYGGGWGYGTVFAVNTNGQIRLLHQFTAINNGINSDGVNPNGGLVLLGTTLYGTARNGGASGIGTVFAINTDGTGFTNLHIFSPNSYYNSGGAQPGGLILSGNLLYGTTSQGGSSGSGTVFAINTDGTGFNTLYSCTALIPYYTNQFGAVTYTNSDGAGPGGLIISGNTLYGITDSGGSSGNGTIFSLSLPITPPQLNIIRSAGTVILSWPTNYAGFNLQSTTNLLPSAVWTTNLPSPVIVNGQYAVTNPVTGRQQFFRLSQ